MYNQFDFYTFIIDLGASYKMKCRKLGINPSGVLATKSYKHYPNGASYPVYNYTVSVGSMDAPEATSDKVNAMQVELAKQYGQKVHVRYIARD